jgi:hypothetical protein
MSWVAWAVLGCAVAGSGCSDAPGDADADAGGDPGGGSPDARAPGLPELDAAPDPEAIVVPPEQLDQWVWIPIPEMACADGTPSGVGVRFTKASRNLVIWFQGNGVCYDFKTCLAFQSLLVGMGPDPLDHMWWGDVVQGHTGIFDRDDPTNPFRDDNFVVLPHCGVDGHTADKESTYPPLPTYQQRGYRNATEALRRIEATFPDATRVVVAGFSAGAIGATANYHQIALAFEALGQPSPFLIADSGPLMRDPYLSQIARDELRAGWGLADTIEVICPECGTEGPGAAYRAIASRHAGVRQSVISSYADGVAGNLYRLLNYDINFIDGDRFRRGLLDMADGSPELRVFYYEGDRHGALPYPLADSPGLVEFLSAQLSGDPAWESVY